MSGLLGPPLLASSLHPPWVSFLHRENIGGGVGGGCLRMYVFLKAKYGQVRTENIVGRKHQRKTAFRTKSTSWWGFSVRSGWRPQRCQQPRVPHLPSPEAVHARTVTRLSLPLLHRPHTLPGKVHEGQAWPYMSHARIWTSSLVKLREFGCLAMRLWSLGREITHQLVSWQMHA